MFQLNANKIFHKSYIIRFSCTLMDRDKQVGRSFLVRAASTHGAFYLRTAGILYLNLASVDVFVGAVSRGQTHAGAIFGNLQVNAVERTDVGAHRLALLPECVQHSTPRWTVGPLASAALAGTGSPVVQIQRPVF
jgi:hypothetical protein